METDEEAMLRLKKTTVLTGNHTRRNGRPRAVSDNINITQFRPKNSVLGNPG